MKCAWERPAEHRRERPPALAAHLRLLTEVLDDSASDVAATMMILISEASLAALLYGSVRPDTQYPPMPKSRS